MVVILKMRESFLQARDDSPLNGYINLLGTKSLLIDSYSREIQGYMSLYAPLKRALTDDQEGEVERAMLDAINGCNDFDSKLQRVWSKLQSF